MIKNILLIPILFFSIEVFAQDVDTIKLPSNEVMYSVMELNNKPYIKNRVYIGAGFTSFSNIETINGNNVYGGYSYSFSRKLYALTQFYVGFANQKYPPLTREDISIKSKLRQYVLCVGAGYRPLYIGRHTIAIEGMVGAGYKRYRSFNFTYGGSYGGNSPYYRYDHWGVAVSLLGGYYYKVAPRNEFGIEWRSTFIRSGWSGGIGFRYTYDF